MFLLLASTTTAATATQMQADPWPTDVGWSARYQIDGEWLNLWNSLIATSEVEDGWQLEVYNTLMWSDYLSVFDPPILYLDLPLAHGKTWECQSTRYTESDTISEHHRFKVEKKTIEISGKHLNTFYVLDDPISGENLGGDYSLPGFGPVAFDFPADDLKLRMTGNSVEGFDPKLGVGEGLM